MGIRHLQSYICKDVPNGFFPVDIKKEVDDWKRKNSNEEPPIIVIDVICMNSSSLYPDLGVSLCGGRHQFIVEEWRKFFNSLINLGVRLVFFMDGPVQKLKFTSIWYERQNESYKNMINILDDVYKNLNTEDLLKKYTNKIPHSRNTISPLKAACKKSGEFHFAFNDKSNLEIAQFATQNNALAVIGEDTDFLIFEGDWKYWSSRNLKHSSLTTMEYNKNALRSALGLSVGQMPLFATFGGNDIVQFDSLKRFLYECGRSTNKFLGIAKEVKFIRNYPGHMNNEIFNQISYKLFGRVDQELTDLIRKSLESYNIKSEPAEPLRDELLCRTFNEDHGFNYKVLTGIAISFPILFYDFRKSDFKNYYELIERLILRPMGILLKHKNDSTLIRKIITKKSQDQDYGEFDVTPEYPKIDVPSLMELLFDKNDDNLIPIRYELLAWIISDKIQAKTLQEIPPIYLLDILVVIYLLENKQISFIEADSVLRTIYEVQNNLVPVDISSPSVIDERAMRFCFLYVKVFALIKQCLGAVGINKLDTQFDALYYHIIYKEYKTIPDDERENMMEDLKDLRSYCLAAL